MGEIVGKLTKARARIQEGMPTTPKRRSGGSIAMRNGARSTRWCRPAGGEGTTIVTGGTKPEALLGSSGYFYAPTVLDAVTQSMQSAREEPFGPVLSILTFEDEEGAINLADDTPYGLVGAVWTQGGACAHRTAAKVRAGKFCVKSYKTINDMSPFSGFGQSGYGRSSEREALATCTQIKSVWVETAQGPANDFGYAPG